MFFFSLGCLGTDNFSSFEMISISPIASVAAVAWSLVDVLNGDSLVFSEEVRGVVRAVTVVEG